MQAQGQIQEIKLTGLLVLGRRRCQTNYLLGPPLSCLLFTLNGQASF